MAESFGARARRFMGWYSPEQIEAAQEAFDYEEEMADVTPLPPADPPFLSRIRHEEDSEAAQSLSRIVTVHPSTYNDALPIGEAFRKGVPVIINLTDMGEPEARRVVDFAAGLTFGLHGVIERVTPRVFLLSPRSVEVSGDATVPRKGALFNQG